MAFLDEPIRAVLTSPEEPILIIGDAVFPVMKVNPERQTFEYRLIACNARGEWFLTDLTSIVSDWRYDADNDSWYDHSQRAKVGSEAE